MSTKQKVALATNAGEQYGLNRTLAALELPKSTWYYHQRHKVSYVEKYAHLHTPLEEIARTHTSYGYRRTREVLEADYDINVGKEVIQRLHRLWELRLLRSTRAPKPSQIRRIITEAGERSNLVAQLAEIELCQVVYTDFTELHYANGAKKAYLMPILEHSSKVVFGWAVAENANTALALQAWRRAKRTLQSPGLACQDLIMHHDQDSVYTSYAWTGQLLLQDHVRLSYALNGAKDNTVMESFNGHFKPENHSLFLEAVSLDELIAVVDERMNYYNGVRLHSSLGYLTPLAFLQQELGAAKEPNGKGEKGQTPPSLTDSCS